MLRSLEKPADNPEYLDFFGLKRPPFARLIDTAQMFQSEQYALLMQHLTDAAEQNDTRVVLCGVDGSGKTTLLNHFVSVLGDNTYFATLNNSCRSAEGFYNDFLSQIGFNEIDATVTELQKITREFLVYRGNAGDPVLLIIDNAHQIDPIILEQLRWISEVQAENGRVLSVVLAGTNDLVRIIDSPAMRQSRFDRHVVFNIRSFAEEETASYVWHRLNLAGGNDGVKIANDAHPLIHRYSGGIPHLVNTLCNDMLSEAYRQKSRVITEKIVRTVADEQRLLPHVVPSHGRGRRRSDPDFKPAADAIQEVEQPAETIDEAPKKAKVVETANKKNKNKEQPSDTSAAEPTIVDPNILQQQIALLTDQVADLRADKERVLADIAARNKDIDELRSQLSSKSAQVTKLAGSFRNAAGELTKHKQAAGETQAALRIREDAAKKFAALLEKEKRMREQAETDVAKAAALADDLESLKEELAARDGAIADLEARLEKADRENDSAKQRIVALENPEDLQKIEKYSSQLAADLEKERHAREAAEAELAESAASVEQSRQLTEELQATVAGLESELKAAGERVVEFETLEKNTAELNDKITEKTAELESVQDEMAVRDKDIASLEKLLAESQNACETAQRRILELKSPQELKEIEKISAGLAADLEKEKRVRNATEQELEEASAAVNELQASRDSLQDTIDGLNESLRAAGEQVDGRSAVEERAAGLQEQVEKRTAELDAARAELASRDEAVGALESRLAEAEKENAAVERRIAELTQSVQTQQAEKTPPDLAAELDDERRARKAAESSLQEASARLDELSELDAERQAANDDLREKLNAAKAQAAETGVLEKSNAALKDLVEEKSAELESLKNELAARDRASEAGREQSRDTQRSGKASRRGSSDDRLSENKGRKADSGQSARTSDSVSSFYPSQVVEKFEQSIRDVRGYQALRENDSKFYERLVAKYRELVGQNLTEKQVNDALRAMRASYIEERLSYTSDGTVIDYAGLIIEQLDEFERDGTEPCFSLLIPPGDSRAGTPPDFSETTSQGELAVLDKTVKTYNEDRPQPSEESVWPNLEPIFAELFDEYGEENVSALQSADDPDIDRTLVCTIAGSLYRAILELPKRQSVNALRWLLST